MMLFLTVLGVASQAYARDLENKADSVMEQALETAKQMTLPVNKYAQEAEQAAQQTAKQYQSPAFQKQLQCEQDRLKEEFFPKKGKLWEPLEAQETQETQQKPREDGLLAEDEKIYLFFSSSVPAETMQAYVADVARVGDPNLMLIMRGFAKSNPRFLGTIMKQDLTCQDVLETRQICSRNQVKVSLRPELFSEFGVDRVPAVVYAKGERGDQGEQVYRVQGDAGFGYALERINREVKSNGLAGLITKLERSGQ